MTDTLSDSNTLTDSQHDWASKFTGMDTRATGNGSASAAPGGAPATAPTGSAAPSDGGDNDPQIQPDWVRVPMEKLAALDFDVQSGVPAMIDKAVATHGDIYGMAALAKADLEKPGEALAPLRKSSKIADGDRRDLKNALSDITSKQGILHLALIQLEAQNNIVLEATDETKSLPPENNASADIYKPARDLYEHIYDALIQATKFALEIKDNPVAAILELAGTDFAKDGVKGGNIDELVGAIKDKMDSVQQTVNQTLVALQAAAAERIKNAARLIQNEVLPAIDKALADLKTSGADFDKEFAAIKAKAGGGGAAAATPAMKNVMALYKQIAATNTAWQDAKVGLKRARALSDINYWSGVMAPIGTQIKDDTAGGGQSTSLLFKKDGKVICFFLPKSPLKNSLDALSAAVEKCGKLNPKDGAEIERMAHDWTAAMVDNA